MYTVEVPPAQPSAGLTTTADVAERAENELRRNAYVALKNISCEYHDGVLVLNGCLPTYYLKQVAQEAIARVDGVQRVENRIAVVSPSSRLASRL
jgi:osmotically-inducible protein OsmY